MSKSGKNRRVIVVDGQRWHWQVTVDKVVAWEPAPGKRIHTTSRPSKRDPGFAQGRFAKPLMGDDMGTAVCPGEVAAWIREDILGLPPAPPKINPVRAIVAPRRPAPAPASQIEAYVVSKVVRYFSDCGEEHEISTVKSVHLDPAVALNEAKLLTGENAERLVLLDSMYKALDEGRKWRRHYGADGNGVESEGESDDRIANKFFERAGIIGEERRRWVRGCPSNLPVWKVAAVPLVGSTLS